MHCRTKDGTLRLDANRSVQIEYHAGHVAIDARRSKIGGPLVYADFQTIAHALGSKPEMRHKDVYVRARRVLAPDGEHIVGGGSRDTMKEEHPKLKNLRRRRTTTLSAALLTTDKVDVKLAERGDYIVTALTQSTLEPITSERWVVKADKFTELYTLCTPNNSSTTVVDSFTNSAMAETPMGSCSDDDSAEGEDVVADLSETLGGLYLGRNLVETVEFRGGVLVAAPWGSDQDLSRQPAYLLYSHVSKEVYACERERCHTMYTVVPLEACDIKDSGNVAFDSNAALAHGTVLRSRQSIAIALKPNGQASAAGAAAGNGSTRRLTAMSGRGLSGTRRSVYIGAHGSDATPPSVATPPIVAMDKASVARIMKKVDLEAIDGTFVHVLAKHILKKKLRERGFRFKVSLDEMVKLASEIKSRCDAPPHADGNALDLLFYYAFVCFTPVCALPTRMRTQTWGWFSAQLVTSTLRRFLGMASGDGSEGDFCCSEFEQHPSLDIKEWTMWLMVVTVWLSVPVCLAATNISNNELCDIGVDDIALPMLALCSFVFIVVPLVVLSRSNAWQNGINELKLMQTLVTVDDAMRANSVQTSSGSNLQDLFASMADLHGLVPQSNTSAGDPENPHIQQEQQSSKSATRPHLTAHDVFAVAVVRNIQPGTSNFRRLALYGFVALAFLPTLSAFVSGEASPAAVALGILRGAAAGCLLSACHSILEEWQKMATALEEFSGLTNERWHQGLKLIFLDLRFPENIEAWRAIRDHLVALIRSRSSHMNTYVTFVVVCLLSYTVQGALFVLGRDFPGASSPDTIPVVVLNVVTLGGYLCLILNVGVRLNCSLDANRNLLSIHLSTLVAEQQASRSSAYARVSTGASAADGVGRAVAGAKDADDVVLSHEALTFDPYPSDLTYVELPRSVVAVLSTLAGNAHDIWSYEKLMSGWKYGLATDSNTKVHAELIK